MNNRPLDPSEMTDAQRTAWQNSWTPDEAMVAHFPEGYWTHLIFMAAIEPANDVFMAIFNEALKLGEGRTEGRYSEAFKLLTQKFFKPIAYFPDASQGRFLGSIL